MTTNNVQLYRVFVNGQEVTEHDKPIELTTDEVREYNKLDGIRITKA